MFYILYRHTDDGIFDDFLKISDHLPKISITSAKFVQSSHEHCRTFLKKFQRFPKIAKAFQGRPKDATIIHQ